MNFEQELNHLSVLVDQYLTKYFDQYDDPFENDILESMRYAFCRGQENKACIIAGRSEIVIGTFGRYYAVCRRN